MRRREPRVIALWGFGREGRASLGHLRRIHPHAELMVIDEGAAGGAELPFACMLAGRDGPAFIAAGRADLLVRSPGVSLYRPEIAAALAAGTRLTSGTSLWLEAHPEAATIAVTGTKGKSTTASLLAHALEAAGLDVALAGNIGRPLLETEPGRDVTVIELSSYQIADLLHPCDHALVLNLHAEHLDWHGSLERYYADKLRIAALSPMTRVIANAANGELVRRLGGRVGTLWFNTAEGTRVEGDILWRGGRALDVALRHKGAHNLANLAAIQTLTDELGIASEKVLAAAAEFAPLPHRLQELGLRNGVLYVDDSISTTPETALAAARVYGGRAVTLLLGGHDRGQDYRAIGFALASAGVRLVLALPDNGARIAAELAGVEGLAVILCTDLGEAVARAREATEPGGVVLLSPGAPSYGRFRDFEERGLAFASLAAVEEGG